MSIPISEAIRKADTLIEALDYIRTFRDRHSVIKLGGSAMEDAATLRTLLQDVVFMATVGMRPILVHGGGKPIDRAMQASGIVPRKVKGRRFTDDATLKIVVDVLCHDINASIVKQVRELGGRAVGLHTASLQCLFGEKLWLPAEDGRGEPIDLGRVGSVSRVDTGLIQDFCAAGVVPVIPCLAVDAHGWLNVNGDTAAAAVASHLKADKLVFLSDTPGILRDRKDEASLLPTLNAQQCRELMGSGVIDTGMIPKVEACLDSLRTGVDKTHMVDGRVPHSLLLEIFTRQGMGTEITL